MEDGVTENEKLQVFSSTEDREDEKESVDKDVEERPAGFMKQLISSFTPDEDDKQQEEKQIDKPIEEKEEQGGGLFTHIMSNLVSSPVSSPRPRDEKQAAGHHLFDNAKSSEKDGGGGGGIIDNIVSNLPTPLPDDAAPASDEASILIHSIIHD